MRLPHRPALRRRAPDRRAARHATPSASSQWGHDKLSVFGIGADLDDAAWRDVFRQLVALGYARADHEATARCKLTEASRPVLKGEQRVVMRSVAAAQGKDGKDDRTGRCRRRGDIRRGCGAARPAQGLARTQAREQSVPAYVIFHDSTLAAIAVARPRMPRRSPASAASARRSWNATARRCWNCCGNNLPREPGRGRGGGHWPAGPVSLTPRAAAARAPRTATRAATATGLRHRRPARRAGEAAPAETAAAHAHFRARAAAAPRSGSRSSGG